MSKHDADFKWLIGHLPNSQVLGRREQLAKDVVKLIHHRIENRALPFTLGIFGGWGCGKTTFLAQVARELRKDENVRVIYFNAWKYAGLMEIVPALIYKLLKQGIPDTDENRNKAAKRVLLSLGKEYSDKFGEWVEERIGVDAVQLFKDVHHLTKVVDGANHVIPEKVVEAYYTQVDRAQDVLVEALGDVSSQNPPEHAVVVLVDELDRCDPDEAFNVIKQLRVLFTMRRVPVVFVIAANPEPIGLAIKHRYGLESEYGDYEARRILEKFVDGYEELSGPTALGAFVQSLWQPYFNEKPREEPWLLSIVEPESFGMDPEDAWNSVTGYEAIETSNRLYSNLRVLKKSFEYVRDRLEDNRHLLWCTWHLEIAAQVDPNFRQDLRNAADTIKEIAGAAYEVVGHRAVTTVGNARFAYNVEPKRSMYAFFRQTFWDKAKTHLRDRKAEREVDPEKQQRIHILEKLLADPKRMQFVISMVMMPIKNARDLDTMMDRSDCSFTHLDNALFHELGYQIASY